MPSFYLQWHYVSVNTTQTLCNDPCKNSTKALGQVKYLQSRGILEFGGIDQLENGDNLTF